MCCYGPFVDVKSRTARCCKCNSGNRSILNKCEQCGDMFCPACFTRLGSGHLHGPASVLSTSYQAERGSDSSSAAAGIISKRTASSNSILPTSVGQATRGTKRARSTSSALPELTRKSTHIVHGKRGKPTRAPSLTKYFPPRPATKAEVEHDFAAIFGPAAVESPGQSRSSASSSPAVGRQGANASCDKRTNRVPLQPDRGASPGFHSKPTASSQAVTEPRLVLTLHTLDDRRVLRPLPRKGRPKFRSKM